MAGLFARLMEFQGGQEDQAELKASGVPPSFFFDQGELKAPGVSPSHDSPPAKKGARRKARRIR